MTRPPGRGGGAHEATARRGRGRSGSLLVLSAPDRDEIYIAEEQVTTPAGVLDTVIRYRLNTERAEIIAAWGAKNEDGTIQPHRSS